MEITLLEIKDGKPYPSETRQSWLITILRQNMVCALFCGYIGFSETYQILFITVQLVILLRLSHPLITSKTLIAGN